MRWYENLYVGESLKDHRLYYQFKIKYSKKPTGTWCILPAAARGDLLDIVHSELLKVKKLYDKDQLVLGIAGTKKEAMLLAGQIVADVMRETGGTDLSSYFDDSRGET